MTVQTVNKIKKVTKFNLKTTAKRHAYLQTLTKKFRKIRGVAFTSFCDGQSDRRTGKNNISPDPDGGHIITEASEFQVACVRYFLRV